MFQEKFTNYRPCSRISRNELVILRITGLLLFKDHSEKFFRSRFTASENRRSVLTENTEAFRPHNFFLVVFDCESDVCRSNLIFSAMFKFNKCYTFGAALGFPSLSCFSLAKTIKFPFLCLCYPICDKTSRRLINKSIHTIHYQVAYNRY